MNDDYRAELNRLFRHADVTVDLRPPACGEIPRWNLKADICLESAAALLLAGVEVLAILVAEGPATRNEVIDILDALPDELDHVLGKR